MGFWPFGGGKKQRAADTTKDSRKQSLHSDPPENAGASEKAGTDISGNTKDSTRAEQIEKPHRLSKTSFPGHGEQKMSQTEPVSISNLRRFSRTTPPVSEKPLYRHNPTSQSSLGPENFHVVRQPPTLHARKSEQDTTVARRKSSKRKAEDYAREREVRAMSTSPIPIPKRPTSFYGSGPLQRETHEIPGVLHRKSHRPTSQVSLPLAESLPNVGDISQQNSFKIGMFAALSPRPTIKYDAHPRHDRGKQPQRPVPVSGPPIAEEDLDADKKRIDELADDLDAGALRELMERDKRRRERKRKQDQSRLERRLQRRADREREEAARKARTEEYVSASASKVHGLGIDPSTEEKAPTITRKTGSLRTRGREAANPFADDKAETSSPVAIRNPFEDEKDMDVVNDASSDIEPEPAIPVRSPLRNIKTDTVKEKGEESLAVLSPPTSPTPRAADRQSMSQGSLLNREATTDIPECASVTGAASDHSSQRLSSWTAFFRKGTRRKMSGSYQGRSTPSEFSNTSRESFIRKQAPPVINQRTFRRADSATPQRTMSKFREDLPELPISPPDSRVQSPENAIAPTTTFNQAATVANPVTLATAEIDPSTYKPSSPIPMRTQKAENKASMELDASTSHKPEMMLSQSLASVDSEASWLSGKPLNRRSGASQRLKANMSSLPRQMPGAFDGANDITPPPDALMRKHQDADVSKEIVEGDETWHAAVARQPMLIRHASRAKSKEGLLNEYAANERQNSRAESEEDEQEAIEEAEPEATVMRARSVDYKRHARHMSAGSARLLDLRRSSAQSGDLLSQQNSPSSQALVFGERTLSE